MIDTRCGLRCEGCYYKDAFGCGGCIDTQGHPFHGECPVAICCQDKDFIHCGQCPDIPCELLSQYSNDPEHGDNPPRRAHQAVQNLGRRQSVYHGHVQIA